VGLLESEAPFLLRIVLEAVVVLWEVC